MPGFISAQSAEDEWLTADTLSWMGTFTHAHEKGRGGVEMRWSARNGVAVVALMCPASIVTCTCTQHPLWPTHIPGICCILHMYPASVVTCTCTQHLFWPAYNLHSCWGRVVTVLQCCSYGEAAHDLINDPYHVHTGTLIKLGGFLKQQQKMKEEGREERKRVMINVPFIGSNMYKIVKE